MPVETAPTVIDTMNDDAAGSVIDDPLVVTAWLEPSQGLRSGRGRANARP
jgi:hypothetical protein